MYTEKPTEALPYRKRIIEETKAWIEILRRECDQKRENHFVLDHTSVSAYQESSQKYRKELIEMLGIPLLVTISFLRRKRKSAST